MLLMGQGTFPEKGGSGIFRFFFWPGPDVYTSKIHIALGCLILLRIVVKGVWVCI